MGDPHIRVCNKEEAYRDIVNTWLKSNPQNMWVCKKVIEQNKNIRASQHSAYGASKANPDDLRQGLALPPGLYYTFVQFERKFGREFLATKKDIWQFMKWFPQFRTAEQV